MSRYINTHLEMCICFADVLKRIEDALACTSRPHMCACMHACTLEHFCAFWKR